MHILGTGEAIDGEFEELGSRVAEQRTGRFVHADDTTCIVDDKHRLAGALHHRGEFVIWSVCFAVRLDVSWLILAPGHSMGERAGERGCGELIADQHVLGTLANQRSGLVAGAVHDEHRHARPQRDNLANRRSIFDALDNERVARCRGQEIEAGRSRVEGRDGHGERARGQQRRGDRSARSGKYEYT